MGKLFDYAKYVFTFVHDKFNFVRYNKTNMNFMEREVYVG